MVDTVVDAAFEVKGNVNAAPRKYFGQAHQQYFTPKWIAEAMWKIAYYVFNLGNTSSYYRELKVLDPTAGTGRLLTEFHKAGKQVLAIELDSRLVGTAKRVLGAPNVRVGDILLYGSLLPELDVMAINPPYALWWNIEGTAYEKYELGNGKNIESQMFCLELAKEKLGQGDNGLLLAVLSDKFLDTYPRVRQFLGKYFHVFANVTLPKPFEEEYGIGVNARFIAAVRKSQDRDETPPGCWTGTHEGTDPTEFASKVIDGFRMVRAPYGTMKFSTGTYPYYQWDWRTKIPEVALSEPWKHGPAKITVTDKGIRVNDDWSATWLKFMSKLPLQAYDRAQGTFTPLDEAYGSLPNLLIAGADTAIENLESLGFEVELNEHNAAMLERRRARYEREVLPIRTMKSAEYLGWSQDGPITAMADVTIGDVEIKKGETWEQRVRWRRRSEVAAVKQGETAPKKGKPKKYTSTTYVDRGHLYLQLIDPNDSERIVTVEEIQKEHVEAYVQAFGLPKAGIVDELPDFRQRVQELEKFIAGHTARTGIDKSLYPIQRKDVARMSTKPTAALLYEQGGGKTATMAHWAAIRGYRECLLVAPASVVPGIIEDLDSWGFKTKRLTHKIVEQLRDQRRQRKLARARVKTALARVANGKARQEDLEIVAAEGYRMKYERLVAKKRRHIRNLNDIKEKGKVTSKKATSQWYKDWETASHLFVQYRSRLIAAHKVLGYEMDEPREEPDYYITSYQDLSLGDHMGMFDHWDHDHYDRDGAYLTTITGNRGSKCSDCGAPRQRVIPECPICNTKWQGKGAGGGRYCTRCGYRPWTMGWYPTIEIPLGGEIEDRKARLEVRKKLRREVSLGADVVVERTVQQWPMYKNAKRLFSCVILDEAQDAKSKSALRGQAARALKANGRGILTGTWIKGYVMDLFWTAGWLMGYGSPLWPYPFKGGSGRFLKQFGTYQYVTKEFADTLEVGRRKLIPSVSNLTWLWKLLAPMSIRRLKEDFLKDLPPKNVEYHWVHVSHSPKHEALVSEVMTAVSDVCKREMRKANPNMQAISSALWWGRYVTSCPNKAGALHYAGAWGHKVNQDTDEEVKKAILSKMYTEGQYLLPPPGQRLATDFAQVAAAMEIIEDVQEKGEKVIVFTSLRGLYETMKVALEAELIKYHEIGNAGTKKRNDLVRAFGHSDATVLLSATGKLNRGITATEANHVIILNLEWSPEPTVQAEDRIHRPGQTKECFVHYILLEGDNDTMDDRMYELVMAKRGAQEAVQDRKAKDQTVAEMLEEAVRANPELAVARSLTDADWSEMFDKSSRTRKTIKKKERKKKEVRITGGGQMGLFNLTDEGETVVEWTSFVGTGEAVATKGGGQQMMMFG